MIRRLSSVLILAACLPFTLHAVTKNRPFQVYDFSKGLDSYHSPTSLPDGFVQDANNVLFDDRGPVSKRAGFSVAWSTKSYSYSGLWSYTDGNNTTWQIVRSSDQITANNFSGSVVRIATVSVNNVVGEVNAFGNAYFVDQSQGVYYWNGTATTYVPGSPDGSIITQFHNRIWVTGAAAPNGNQLYGSGYYNGSDWGTNIFDTSAVTYPIGLQDNFDNVTAEYVYLDTLYLFKHSSIFALYGFSQITQPFQISQLTQECGCVDGGSIQTYESGLKFVSLRGVENFNGYSCTRISDAIKDKIDPAIQASGFSQGSWVLQSQSDWNSGTINQLSANISPPALVLSTQAAFAGVDNTQADWSAATLVNLDTTTNVSNLQLSFQTWPAFIDQSFSASGSGFFGNNNSCNTAQSFTTGNYPNLVLQTANLTGCATGTGTQVVDLMSDSSGAPGTVLTSGQFNLSSFPRAVGLNCFNGTAVVNVSIPYHTLSPNTKYWIYLPATGNSNQFGWLTSANTYGGGNGYASCDAGQSSESFSFSTRVTSASYFSNGAITSRVFDVGTSTNNWLWNWGTLTTQETDNGGSIVLETQVSTSSLGPWDTPVPVNSGGTIGSATKEFIQYIASFTAANINSQTPVLSNVTFGTTAMEKSSGTFASPIHNIGTSNSWGNFSIQEILNSGNIAFSICSSPSSNMAPASCMNQTPNSQITISTNPYVQWFATFTVTSQAQTPILNNGTVQWFTGVKPNPMASTVWDDRYFLSLTTNTVDSANDAVVVLDSKGAWTRFDIHAGAFTQQKNNLYHADSSPTGNIYLDNQGTSDNGAAINAYIRTKDISFGDLASYDYLYAIYPSANNTGNCSMTSSYVVDNSTSSFPLGTVNLQEYGTLSAVKLPFPIDAAHQDFAQSMDFTFRTDDSVCKWVFFGFDGLFKQRPVN